MSPGPVIDHDPRERRRKKDEMPYLFPLGFVVIALMWAWYFVYQSPHWVSVGLGFVSGGMMMAWAADKFGDRPYKDLFTDERPPE
ncbi:hypothetical protein [Rhizobium terrae]|uniref:hypothetical protein n=1 Tax=Rhizobium terrae TaxID=2171756 RepID=UPI000E3BA3BC|nr:hypothetical protein [Rhizobium terrae]